MGRNAVRKFMTFLDTREKMDWTFVLTLSMVSKDEGVAAAEWRWAGICHLLEEKYKEEINPKFQEDRRIAQML
jgi:hypothetical protein